MVQWVKNPPAMQETLETWVQSLGQEDPLEKEMTTHSSILAWKKPSYGQRRLVGYSPRGRKESDTTECLNTGKHTGYSSGIISCANIFQMILL